jgi:hypothetical protein
MRVGMHRSHSQDSSDSDEEEAHRPGRTSLWSILSLILFLFSVIFLGLQVYALLKYNTDAVRDACPNLLVFVNVRTVVALLVFVSLYTYIFCVHHGKSDHGQEYIEAYDPRVLIGVAVGYFLVCCVAGALVVLRCMVGNSACVAILQDSVFRMPLLGILGWVYLVSDGLFAAFFIYLLSSIVCRSGYAHHRNDVEMDV